MRRSAFLKHPWRSVSFRTKSHFRTTTSTCCPTSTFRPLSSSSTTTTSTSLSPLSSHQCSNQNSNNGRGRRRHRMRPFLSSAFGSWAIAGIIGASCMTLSASSLLAESDRHDHAPKPDYSRKLRSDETAERRWSQLRLFSGSANEELAKDVAACLGARLSPVDLNKYADGEIGIRVMENVRGKDVFIIQPTCPPGVNDNLMELLLLISTMRRSSAASITAVLPYYGYARQDRKMQSRVPISAADVARLIESMGVDRVVAVDLHCGQIQGFFGPRTPCDNLDGSVAALMYFKDLVISNETVIVSPDAGGVYRAKRFRDGLKKLRKECGLAMLVKQRQAPGKIEQMDLVGNVEGKDVIIVDDMIDTAGTLCRAGLELKKRGARKIYAFATHGLFNGPAMERINNSAFEKVVVCDTVPLNDKHSDKIEVLSIASLLAKAIYSIHFNTSISMIFEIDSKKGSLSDHPLDLIQANKISKPGFFKQSEKD